MKRLAPSQERRQLEMGPSCLDAKVSVLSLNTILIEPL